MDGVIADFESYVLSVSGKTCRQLNTGHAIMPFSNDERTDPVFRLLKEHVTERDMFYHVPPVEDLHLWRELFASLRAKNIRVELLSASPSESLHPMTKDQKKRWVERHNIVVDDVIVVPESYVKRKYARSSSILVDDYHKNVVSYIKSGGLAILHKQFDETKDRLDFYISQNNNGFDYV